MYLTLDVWKDSETLLKAAIPAVFPRDSEDTEKISAYSQGLQNRFGVRTETVKNSIVEISSSQLREMLPNREGAGYITDTTYSYIIKNRLYGAKPDWEWLRGRAYSKLEPLRIPHVAGCEDEAIRLAGRWGADIDDAREAAILHDITKKLALNEHVKILDEHGVDVRDINPAEEKLLHSKSGSALAKSLFGVSDDVAGAIMWHTTGRAGMTLLEKVIYLADYIEPTRDFPGVGDLRAAAYSNLDEALIMGLKTSIQDMEDRGITPNRTTFDALYDLGRYDL
jgi:nicotinate-nucleotide adenylyltransferase